jgi:uncharacterized protein (TIGR02145 family)
MKKQIFALLSILMLPLWVIGQAPLRFSYQAVLRSQTGQVLANQNVSMRISLLQGSESGSAEYVETQNASTNALGLISLQIGGGSVQSGSLASINWASGPFFIKTETDPSGGSNYVLNGVSQLLSVPYALYAGSANPAPGTAIGQMMYWNGSSWVMLPIGTPGQVLSVSNSGIPTWTTLQGNSTVSDVDGNTYNTVTIGSQVWMKENLKVSKYRNGDPIPTNLDNAAWQNTTNGAFAIYESNPVNDSIYGKLYNWYAVADPRGLCPTGWHVPSDAEWTTLENFLGGVDVAGGKMKSTGTIQASTGLWLDPNTGATNSSGFTAFPGGFRGYAGIVGYIAIGDDGDWWSSTEAASTLAWYRSVTYDVANSYRVNTDKAGGFSVRCLRD